MKVMLITTPNVSVIEPFRSMKRQLPAFVWGFPFGLGYLAAVLEKNSIDVKIVDAHTLGMDIPEIMHEVKTYQPDVVGISRVVRLLLRQRLHYQEQSKNIIKILKLLWEGLIFPLIMKIYFPKDLWIMQS